MYQQISNHSWYNRIRVNCNTLLQLMLKLWDHTNLMLAHPNCYAEEPMETPGKVLAEEGDVRFDRPALARRNAYAKRNDGNPKKHCAKNDTIRSVFATLLAECHPNLWDCVEVCWTNNCTTFEGEWPGFQKSPYYSIPEDVRVPIMFSATNRMVDQFKPMPSSVLW